MYEPDYQLPPRTSRLSEIGGQNPKRSNWLLVFLRPLSDTRGGDEAFAQSPRDPISQGM